MQDLGRFATKLLQFAATSVEEALVDPQSRSGLLNEADGALAVLSRTLRRENPTAFTQMMLLGTFDLNLTSVVDEPDAVLHEKIEQLQKINNLVPDMFTTQAPNP